MTRSVRSFPFRTMTRGFRACSLAALLLCCLTACATPRTLPAVWTPVPAEAAEPYFAALWTLRPVRYHIRLEAQLTYGKRKAFCAAFVRLDTAQGEARVVGMNEMGLTLFDLTVTRAGETLHTLAPLFGQASGFAAAAATVIRNLVLDMPPGAGMQAAQQPEVLRAILPGPGCSRQEYLFSRRESTLFTKSCQARNWQLRCSDYRPAGGVAVPHRLQYEDARYDLVITALVRSLEVK